MFYCFNTTTLYRRYPDFGYITDSNDFSYRMVNDNRVFYGETYVSNTAAAMLDVLTKEPQDIDDIISKLLNIFEGVDSDTLKQDVIQFYDQLIAKGYLIKIDSSSSSSSSSCISESYTTLNMPDNISEQAGDTDINNISQLDFLRSIHVEVTDACNERCVHCYIPHDCKKSVMDPQLFERIIKEGRDLNAVHITISGGEPLLHKNIKDFLVICRKNDMAVNLLSNLTHLNDELLTEMKLNPLLGVQTSIYSMDPKIHDGITKLSGSLDMTLKAIDKLLAAGIVVQISCPVMKQNFSHFNDVMTWAAKLNMPIAVNPVLFASYDKNHSEILSNRLNYNEISQVLDAMMNESYAKQLQEEAVDKLKALGEDPVCSVLRYSFCVAANGKVFPCIGWQSHVIGDLTESSMKEIWSNSPEANRLRSIRKNSFPNCLSCEDRGYCTLCIMQNENESNQDSLLHINSTNCQLSALKRKKSLNMIYEKQNNGLATEIYYKNI